MNPVELPNAADANLPIGVILADESRMPATIPARGRHAAAAPNGGHRFLHAAVILLLALELLPVVALFPWMHGHRPDWGLGFPMMQLPPVWRSEPHYPTAIEAAAPMIVNSFFVAALTTVGTLGFGLLAASFLARERTPASRWLWRGYVALLFLPTALNVVPLIPLLTGMHLYGSRWALVFVGVAGGQALAVCVLRQAIDAIPRRLIQAAELDCVSPWQRIRHVVLPACAPTLAVLGVLTFAGSWNDFLLPTLLLRDPAEFTVGAGLIFLGSLDHIPWSYVCAVYCLVSLPVVFLGLWTLRVFMRALTIPFARD